MNETILQYEEAVSRFFRLSTQTKKDLPIRASEMGMLIFIQRNEGPTTPVMISQYFGIAKPSVTEMVNSLVKKDYLRKVPSQEDKRSYELEVTEKGYELLETTYGDYQKTVQLLQEKLGNQELEVFISLVQKINIILGGVNQE